MKPKYIISTNEGRDFIKQTGWYNTYIYTSREDATKFDSKRQAKQYAAIMPKDLELTIHPVTNL